MAFPNPLADADVFDYAILGDIPLGGGEDLYGIADVDGGADPRKLDEKEGYAQDGAGIVFAGRAINHFTLTLTMWKPEHLDYYAEVVVPVLAALPTGKNPKSLGFYHPKVSEPPCSITAVMIEEPAALVQTDPGVWVASIKMARWVKPKPSYGKPAAKKTQSKTEPVQDAQDKEIEALTQQLKDLQK